MWPAKGVPWLLTVGVLCFGNALDPTSEITALSPSFSKSAHVRYATICEQLRVSFVHCVPQYCIAKRRHRCVGIISDASCAL